VRYLRAFSLLGLFLPASLAATAPHAGQDSRRDDLTRTIYVSVLDNGGAPVTDLTAPDFVIKEGGKDREIVNAGMTSVPLRIALLVDDNGTGIFRYGVAKFIDKNQIGSTDDCGFSPFSIDEKPNHGSPDYAREVAFSKIKSRVEGSRMAADKLGI